jgi:hypothetical protein
MISSQNSANLKSTISTSSSSREKFQNQMRVQKIATATISAITRGPYTTSVPMAAYLQRIGAKILRDYRSKEILRPSIRDPPNTTREAELETVVDDMVEAHTH